MKAFRLCSNFVVIFLWLCSVSVAAEAPKITFKFKSYSVPGQLQTWLTGINNAGVIVGWYADQQGNEHGFSLTNGKFKQIDDPDGDQTEIWGINSNGDMVGFYHDPCIEELCYEGFIYRNGKFANIGPPWFRTPPEDDAPDSEAFGINDGGVIVGTAGDGFGGNVGFVRANRKYKMLKVPGANGEHAVGINNAGLLTMDWATNTAFGVSLYDGKTYKNISVPSAVDSYEGGINSPGDVVLAFDAGVGHPIHGALLYSGRYHKFDYTFVHRKGKYFTLPFGVNDNRTIVGVWDPGPFDNIHVHGFIATY